MKMKKLVFMLAAATMVATTQAASVKWTCTNVKENNAGVSGVAYFVNAATLSQASLSSFTSASDFSSALSGMYSWTPTTAGNYGNTVANADLGLTDATTGYSAYLLIFDTATITDASKYYTTMVKEFATYGGTDTASLAWGGQGGRISSVGWTDVKATDPEPPEPPIDSPEPTSGLLMLIGAAGLALRRKRA